MSMRHGYSVGATTEASSLADQLKAYKLRDLVDMDDGKDDGGAEGKDGDEGPGATTSATMRRVGAGGRPRGQTRNPAHESLALKCIKTLAENFSRFPVQTLSNPEQLRLLTERLPVDLDPVISAKYVDDESYWKRCCIERFGWQNCQLAEHGLMWKQLYFETLLQQRLEEFDPQVDSLEELMAFVDAAQDYIFTLTVRQLLSHLDLEPVAARLSNLARFDVTYGVRKIGMKYERTFFGMKISDAAGIAKCIASAQALTTVVLRDNIMDDDLLRMVMTGLIQNDTITYLDLSHNRITDHGARLLSKLLGENSVLTSLVLADNQIHAGGGRYLGRGLRNNDSLCHLNLRLNRLTDEGGRLLLEGFQDNTTLSVLNLSSNGLGMESATALASILRDPQHNLIKLDVSSNELAEDHIRSLGAAVELNSTLISLDLRCNPGYNPTSPLAQNLDEHVRGNEARAASNMVDLSG